MKKDAPGTTQDQATQTKENLQLGPGFTLITGASSGIGMELAEVFAKHHHNLILTARNEPALIALKEKLERSYKVRIFVLAQDLAVPRAAEILTSKIHGHDLEVDVLVNNAGFGDHGPLAEADAEKIQRMIQLNVVALTALTQSLLPSMIQRRSGRIMNVASVAGFTPGPWMSVYYATKAFVLSFSLGIREEVSQFGISVTALCPGPTKSEFAKNANFQNAKLFESSAIPTSRTVAEYGYRVCMRGEAVAVHGKLNQIMVNSMSLIPSTWLAKAVRKMQQTRQPIN